MTTTLPEPGLIQTRLADAFDAETKPRVTARTPLRRLGKPEDIAHAVLYLSAPAGGFVSGSSLVVDGGMSVGLF